MLSAASLVATDRPRHVSFFTNSAICTAGSVSVLMPMTSNPRSWYCLYRSLMFSISARQGPHQVAQKSISTTLPRYLAQSRSCRRGSCPQGASSLPTSRQAADASLHLLRGGGRVRAARRIASPPRRRFPRPARSAPATRPSMPACTISSVSPGLERPLAADIVLHRFDLPAKVLGPCDLSICDRQHARRWTSRAAAACFFCFNCFPGRKGRQRCPRATAFVSTAIINCSSLGFAARILSAAVMAARMNLALLASSCGGCLGRSLEEGDRPVRAALGHIVGIGIRRRRADRPDEPRPRIAAASCHGRVMFISSPRGSVQVRLTASTHGGTQPRQFTWKTANVKTCCCGHPYGGGGVGLRTWVLRLGS